VAQTAPSLFISYIDARGNSVALVSGAVISFAPAALGTSASVTVSVANRNPVPLVLSSVVIGGDGFQLLGAPLPATTIGPNTDVRFLVQFTPKAIGATSGSLIINGSEQTRLTLSGTGLGPTFSYQIQTGALAPGDSIPIADTAVGDRKTANVSVQNTGNVPGRITAIGVTGTGFSLADPPFTPLTINPGASQTITVAFAPAQPGRATGRLQIGDDSFGLVSTGIGPLLGFFYSVGETSVPLPTTAGTVSISPVAVGSPRSTRVTVSNTGTAAALIAIISLDDPNHIFNLADLPPLPLRLEPGEIAAFSIVFTPVASGPASTTLRVDANTFSVVSSATGPSLAFFYTVGGADTPLSTLNGTVSFSPVAVGETTSTTVRLVNTGSAQAIVSNIGVEGGNGAFSLAPQPALPLRIDPGGRTSFNVVFAPNTTGAANATLRIDTNSFILAGSGNAPAALPNVVFDGAASPQTALAQPSVGLSLAAPYPLKLNGTLTLSFDSDVFVDDPSIQFSSGGRTIAFTIPANGTRAVFPNSSAQARFQTGSVAGTINLRATFQTDAGLTLPPPASALLQLAIPPSAPRITNAQADSIASNSLTLPITGLATSRRVSQISLQFTPVTGLGLSAVNSTLNVDSNFAAWYQSAASQPAGSLFTVTIPLGLQGQVAGVTNLVQAFASVTVTLSNPQGNSTPQTIPLR